MEPALMNPASDDLRRRGKRRPSSHRLLIAMLCLAVIAVAALVYVVVRWRNPNATPSTTVAPSSAVGAHAYMSPSGRGNCAAAAPCSDLQKAITTAGNGGIVEMAAGQYPRAVLNSADSGSPRTRDVLVHPASGANVQIASVRSSAAHVHFADLNFSGTVYLTPEANFTTLDHVHVKGLDASVLVRSSNVLVEDSVIEGGHAHDGINIASRPPNHDITIVRNTIRNYTTGGFVHSEHPDCIQLFDTNHVKIEQNSLSNCYNSAITFSPGANLGISDVYIAGNFMQGCLPELQRCGNGGSVLDLRQKVDKVVVLHNTFGHGSLRLPAQPGVSAPANIVTYLSTTDCSTALSDSVIGDYPTGLCKGGLPGLAAGDWLGTVTFKDEATTDLRLVGSVPAPPTGTVHSIGGPGRYSTMPPGTVGAAG
jgi:hypothetical protein